LDVSVRTAQRYLRELSALPCVITHDDNNNYEICPDYKLKEALLNSSFCEIVLRKLNKSNNASTIDEVYCVVCSKTRDELSHSLLVFKDKDLDDSYQFEQLNAAVKDMLRLKKDSFME
jgi:hypothetical protein